MSQTSPLLQVQGLHSGYGKIPVLRDLSFAIWPNEIVAILGANGAGKSTLMRTLSGLLQPSAGSISFAGHDIGRLGSSDIVKLGLAQAPEGRRMFSGLTVEENLRLGAFARPDKDAASVHSDLDAVFAYFPRLNERRLQLAGTLSGGEQQMCAIGRALMGRPKMLMIDELSLGLAPIIVEALLEALILVHEGGTTILLVEQDVSVALGFADRAIVLETGRIVRTGDCRSMLAEDDIVRNYLGENA